MNAQDFKTVKLVINSDQVQQKIRRHKQETLFKAPKHLKTKGKS